jgi:hypothetical protein
VDEMDAFDKREAASVNHASIGLSRSGPKPSASSFTGQNRCFHRMIEIHHSG